MKDVQHYDLVRAGGFASEEIETRAYFAEQSCRRCRRACGGRVRKPR